MTRLLLDPYLCFGPGTEHQAQTLAAIAGHCGALGLSLCVEETSWDEAAVDPDVVRRRVALWRFEPLTRIPELPLPSKRDLAARFVPVRNEIDRADLKLLGGLHARRVDLLIADDGRLHRLASRAGLGSRVLTSADALAWLEALAGQARDLAIVEIEPRMALATPALERLLAEDCEPFDPYLATRIEAPGTRVLVANDAGRPVSLGVLTEGGAGPTLAAVATADGAQGHRATEPLVAAALAIARRQRMPLEALVAPHQDHLLLLLDALGFERNGRDRHGRELLRRPAEDVLARPSAGRDAWLWPLDAASHDRLMPELAGAGQTELFGSVPSSPSLGGPVRKQILCASADREPECGDLLYLFHAPPDRIRSATVTAAARVSVVTQAKNTEDLVALTAGRRGEPLPRLHERLDRGPVSVIDLHWLGRLARPLSVSALIEREVIAATPSKALRLPSAALQKLGTTPALA